MPYEVDFGVINGKRAIATFPTTPTQKQIDEVALTLKKPEQKQPGLLRSVATTIAKEAIKPFARVGTSVANVGLSAGRLLQGDVAGAQKELQASRNLPFMGETKPAFTGQETPLEMAKKVGGYGAEIGSWIVGGGGLGQVAKQTLKGQVVKGLAQGAKAGAISGGMAGAGRTAEELGTAGEIATSGALGAGAGGAIGGVIGGVAPIVGVGAKKIFQPIEKQVSSKIREAIDKGLKPGKASIQKGEQFYNKAQEAFQILAKRKPAIEVADEAERVVKLPETRAEMLDALSQTKKQIYSEYTDLAEKAGGAKYNTTNVANKLQEIAQSKKYNPQVRKHAEELFYELEELNGESPVVIQERIQDLNNSLTGLYEGRVPKAKAQVDVSVAELLRKDLDNLIEQNAGEGYQALRNEYSALKSVEKDLANQVAVEARKNTKGLIDFTDIFTGGDLFAGAITANPALIARGVAGGIIKRTIKSLNDPNRFIKGAFEALEKQSKVPAGSSIATRLNKTLEKKMPVGLSIEDVSKKGNQSLIQEAKKYKTVDEFVKAQGETLYHGGGETINEFTDKGRGGVFLTSNKKMAQTHADFQEFSGGKSVITEAVANPKNVYKIKKGTNSFSGLDNDIIIEQPEVYTTEIKAIKAKGFDAIQSSDGKQLFIFDPNIVKTKSQLTDIWNKANKK